ncbi:MAG: DEAD/DEAH box helicase, partial [Chloroflexi bacterium]
GIGLAAAAYEKMEELLGKTLQMISSCGCDTGCPSCVHSPKCGSGNRPIDKAACLWLLEAVISGKYSDCPVSAERIAPAATAINRDSSAPPHLLDYSDSSSEIPLPESWGVFDLETIRSAAEVGGWSRVERMGMSVGVVYDSRLDDYVSYLEPEAGKLVAHLREFDLVVGFNNKRFDNQVLAGYGAENLHLLPNLDLLEEVQNQLGYRLKLDNLAGATLGEGKSGDGLDALRWYKAGEIGRIVKYCKKDVEITKALFLYGLENGYLLFTSKAGQLVQLPLQLEESISRLLAEQI